MENNFFLAFFVFTHVCVFTKSIVALPIWTDEATESSVERQSPRPPTAAVDYMQTIYHSKSADLSNGVKAATSNVWCFVPMREEIGEVQAKTDLQPELSGKCPELVKYTFNTKLFIKEHEEEKEMVTISKGMLRVYVQMQPKIDRAPGKANVTITTRMVSTAENISAVVAVKKISITGSESSNWKELPINEELQQLYPLMTPDTQIVFELKIEAGCSTEEQVPMVQLPGLADYEHQPHLVIFTDHKESEIDTTEPEMNTPEESRYEETILEYLFGNHDFKRSTSTTAESELCERQPFDAVFQDLGLDVILAPYSADIGICSGPCSHLSFRASVLTNYARLLQSAVGSGEGDAPQTEQACCIPSKFSGLYLLITYPDESVALRFFPKAVVDKCKCTI